MAEARRRRETGDSCENCAFWEKYAHTGNSGECHAGPPLAIPVAMVPAALQGHPPRSVCQGVWPPTAAGGWCGAHERASPRSNAMTIDLSKLGMIEGKA